MNIDEKEYLEKKLQTAQSVLPTLLGLHSIEYIIDNRKRASLIFHSLAIAEDVMREIGYTSSTAQSQSTEELTAIRKLSDMLKKDSED